jgi:HrpA-like RNA helicase
LRYTKLHEFIVVPSRCFQIHLLWLMWVQAEEEGDDEDEDNVEGSIGRNVVCLDKLIRRHLERSECDVIIPPWVRAWLAEVATPPVSTTPLVSSVPFHLRPLAGARDALTLLAGCGNILTLPFAEHAQELLRAVDTSPLVCVKGETGCGKTVGTALLLLKSYPTARIYMTQPRRIAARNCCKYVKELLGGDSKNVVSYAIGNDHSANFSAQTRLIFCTTGWLFLYLAHNPRNQKDADIIVLDEAHIRTVPLDFLAFLVKSCMKQREMNARKVVVMSATLEAEAFQEYFQELLPPRFKTPTIALGVRRFPVTFRYLNDILPKFSRSAEMKALQKHSQLLSKEKDPSRLIRETWKHFVNVLPMLIESDIAPIDAATLIFVPGMSELEELWSVLLAKEPRKEKCSIVGMHSLFDQAALDEVFEPIEPGSKRIILATNIAESSVTLPEVACVIDLGLEKRMLYDYRRDATVLSLCFASRDAKMQRAGRTGRTRAGIVLRLCLKEQEDLLPLTAPPEMEHSPPSMILLEAIAHCATWGSGIEVATSLPSPLSEEVCERAMRQLRDRHAVIAVGEKWQLSSLGEIGAHLPIPLDDAILLLVASQLNLLWEGLILAARMVGHDPFVQVRGMYYHATAEGEDRFFHDTSNSLQHRTHWDAGYHSQHFQIVRLMTAYFRLDPTKAKHAQFAAKNGVNRDRLTQVSSSMRMIAQRLLETANSRYCTLTLSEAQEEMLQSLRQGYFHPSKINGNASDTTLHSRVMLLLCLTRFDSIAQGKVSDKKEKERLKHAEKEAMKKKKETEDMLAKVTETLAECSLDEVAAQRAIIAANLAEKESENEQENENENEKPKLAANAVTLYLTQWQGSFAKDEKQRLMWQQVIRRWCVVHEWRMLGGGKVEAKVSSLPVAGATATVISPLPGYQALPPLHQYLLSLQAASAARDKFSALNVERGAWEPVCRMETEKGWSWKLRRLPLIADARSFCRLGHHDYPDTTHPAPHRLICDDLIHLPSAIITGMVSLLPIGLSFEVMLLLGTLLRLPSGSAAGDDQAVSSIPIRWLERADEDATIVRVVSLAFPPNMLPVPIAFEPYYHILSSSYLEALLELQQVYVSLFRGAVDSSERKTSSKIKKRKAKAKNKAPLNQEAAEETKRPAQPAQPVQSFSSARSDGKNLETLLHRYLPANGDLFRKYCPPCCNTPSSASDPVSLIECSGNMCWNQELERWTWPWESARNKIRK